MRGQDLERPLTMVLGGAASGKSAFAEALALGDTSAHRRHYIATAQAFDAEMRAKITRHQQMRANDGWTTHEVALDVADHLASFTDSDVVLLDCATLWLTNQMMAEADLAQTSDALTAALAASAAHVIVVTNEVGQGIVPEHAMSRHFREAQGALNQAIAREAGLVVQVIAGLPQVLKGQLP